MGITVYSVVISVFFFNLALIVAFVMRRSGVFLARRTLPFLTLTVFLGIVRLLTPIDFDRAFVVRSYQWIPAIEALLTRPFAGSYTLGSLLLGLWLAGTAAFLIRDTAKQIHFVRTSRCYPPFDRRDLLDLAGEYGNGFGLVVSTSISRPYAAGLLRPTIYLPDLALPEEQWRIILRHEVQHIRSHDEWKKLFFRVVQALFWWNPLAHISRKELDTLIELQCDAKVTADMSDEEVDAYVETLNTLMTRARERRLAVTASPLVWDAKQMYARFQALVSMDTTVKKRPPIAAYVLLIIAFLASYMVLVQPAYAPSKDDFVSYREGHTAFDRTQNIKGADSIQIVFEDGEYVVYIDGEFFSVIDEEILSDPEYFNPLFDAPILGGN